MIKFSVVIPVYNAAPYIVRALLSVFHQTEQGFEVIVVDDGSTDGGGEIVRAIRDPRLRILRQENAGVSAARNKGIYEAVGEYIAFLDADDEWDPGFLTAVVALSNQYPQAGIFASAYRMVFPKGPSVEITAIEASNQKTSLLITDYFYRATGGIINSSGVVIPRKILDEIGGFITGEHHGEDLELWARIALRYPIAYDTHVLFSFHQTVNTEKKRFREMPKHDPKVRMLSRYLHKLGARELLDRKVILSHITQYLTQQCFCLILNGDRASILQYIEGSEVECFLPMFYRLLQIRILWPVMKVISYLYVYSQSRTVMKYTNNKRVSRGVLYRLGVSTTDEC